MGHGAVALRQQHVQPTTAASFFDDGLAAGYTTEWPPDDIALIEARIRGEVDRVVIAVYLVPYILPLFMQKKGVAIHRDTYEREEI